MCTCMGEMTESTCKFMYTYTCDRRHDCTVVFLLPFWPISLQYNGNDDDLSASSLACVETY